MGSWEGLRQAFLLVGGTHDQRFDFMMQAYDMAASSGALTCGVMFASSDIYVDGDDVQRAVGQAGAMLDRLTTAERFLMARRSNIALVCDSPLDMDDVNAIKSRPFGGVDLWRGCVGMQPKMSNYGYILAIDDNLDIVDSDGSAIEPGRVLAAKDSPQLLAALMNAIGCDDDALRS